MSIARSDWPRLLTLVEQALDLSATQRHDWLRDLELHDSLKNALRGLLAQREVLEKGKFLAELPVLPRLASAPALASRLITGGLIGVWRLLRELGQGGMSTVWLAERADDQITRQVAIKLPHAGPGHDLLAERLMRERDILAALEHPNIARLYDVGLTDAGTPYLVMEYVEGDSLLTYADSHRLTIRQRLALFQQVLRAVKFAHAKLVLHRDIKPGNILVNQAGEPKLLDFGIAKLLSTDGSHVETELTLSTGRRLTLAYASPEQLLGAALSTASDVYSLGVVLYELLCGQRPLSWPGMSLAQSEEAILNQEPKPLERHVLDESALRARGGSETDIRKTLAGDLNAIVFKALAKVPERRYASVDALDADVTLWLAGRPVTAHGPGRWYFFAKFVNRHSWTVGLGALAVTALSTVSAVAVIQAGIAERQATRAASVRDFLVAMFNETDPNRAASKELTAKTLLANGRQRALIDLQGSPELMAELLQYIGTAQANLSDRIDADQTLSMASHTYRRLGNGRQLLHVLMSRAENALALGRIDNAASLLDEAEGLSAGFESDAALNGTLMRERAYVALWRRDWPSSRKYLEGYLELDESHPGLPPLHRVEALQTLATALSRTGDLEGARLRIEQALRTLLDHPEIPVSAKMDVINYRQDIDYQWGRYADVQRLAPSESLECDQRLSPLSEICLKLKLRLQETTLRLGWFDQAQALNNGLAPMLNPSSPRDRLAGTAAILRARAFAGQSSAQPEMVKYLESIATAPAETSFDANFLMVALNALAEHHLLGGDPGAAWPWIEQADLLVSSERATALGEIDRLRVFKGMALHLQGHDAQALAALAPLCAPTNQPAGMTRVQDHYLSLNCVAPMLAQGQLESAIGLLQRALPVLRDNLGEASPTTRRANAWLESLRSTRTLPQEKEGTPKLFS